MYLAGYAVELALKARICETLGWSWFPSSSAEFGSYRSLQTHDLKVLLEFSGIKNRVKVERADCLEESLRSGGRIGAISPWVVARMIPAPR